MDREFDRRFSPSRHSRISGARLIPASALVIGIMLLTVAASRSALGQETSGSKTELEDALERIGRLEREIKALRGSAEPAHEEDQHDHDGDHDHHDDHDHESAPRGLFDSALTLSEPMNLQVSGAFDVVASGTNRRETLGNQDRFYVREAEITLTADIGSLGYAYLTFEGSSGAEEEIEFTEAAGIFTRLPANLSIKAGKFFGDFGHFGPTHEHDLPFLEKPGVYYDYFDGSFNPIGVELHQASDPGGSFSWRWSLGMANDPGTHGHPLLEVHDHRDFDSPDKRRLDNLTYNARLVGFFETGPQSGLQVGLSANWAPEFLAEEDHDHDHGHEDDDHEESDEDPFETRSFVRGLDILYRWRDEESSQHLIVGSEVFGSFAETMEEEVRERQRSYGGYAWAEYGWSESWSAGLIYGRYQLRENDSIHRNEISTYITRHFSPGHRLRLHYRFHDVERFDPIASDGDDFHETALQWTFLLGAHDHRHHR